MRGRKPLDFSSETQFFWLVGGVPKPLQIKGFEGVPKNLAGHFALLAGHPAFWLVTLGILGSSLVKNARLFLAVSLSHTREP